MADDSNNLLTQDRIIEIPEFLLSSSSEKSITVYSDCDNAQTDCTGCLGAPCQGNNCQTSCQTTCELGCQTSCQTSCQTTCQISCQSQGVSAPTESGSLSVVSVSSASIRVKGTSISGATSYIFAYRTGTGSAEYKTSSSTTCTISGLSPDTTYIINYRGVNSGGYGPYMSSGIEATTASARPDNWAWVSDISQGAEISITASEWNNFCNRINEFRDYKSLSPYTSFVTAVKGDSISAIIVNHAITALSDMTSAAPETVSPGDVITAAFFDQLCIALNGIT